MLVIRTEEFEMVQVKSGPFFNFHTLTTINEGKDSERKEMKLSAYGLPFETCMKLAVDIELRKYTDSVSVAEFIKRYQSAVDKISKLITEEDCKSDSDNLNSSTENE